MLFRSQRQQQQRFLPSSTTATTTNTSNTQYNSQTAATSTLLQQDQQQQENVTTATQSTPVDENEDGKPSVVNHKIPETDDQKLVAEKQLEEEDHDDNNSQFNQQGSIATSAMAILPDSETATTVPSLLPIDDNTEAVNDSVATTSKRTRDINGVPESSPSVKRRRRTNQ